MQNPIRLSLGLIAVAALAGAARAQSTNTSGGMDAEMQAQTSAPVAKSPRRTAKKPPSASMNTTGAGPSAAPTGP